MQFRVWIRGVCTVQGAELEGSVQFGGGGGAGLKGLHCTHYTVGR